MEPGVTTVVEEMGLGPDSAQARWAIGEMKAFLDPYRWSIRSLVLFGSYALGNATSRSDIDFLVLLKNGDGNKRVRKILFDFKMSLRNDARDKTPVERGGNMKKKKRPDPLIDRMERALDLGEFIPYNQSWEFVRDLEVVKGKIDDLTESEEADRAVRLYELFLSGCYEKAGRDRIWLSLVDSVRKNHSRKYSFIGDFEQIVAGHRPDVPESFEKRARKKWKKQTSK